MSEHADYAHEFVGPAGRAFAFMGEDTLALRYLEPAAAAGDEAAARQLIRMRGDRPALQQLAREALERDLSPWDWLIGDLLAGGGMPEEALEIFRRCGLVDLAKKESVAGHVAMFGLATMIAVLQMQGEVEEAERLLPQLTDFTEAIAAHGAHFSLWRVLQAQALALSGRSDAALERLGLAVDSMGMPWPVYIPGKRSRVPRTQDRSPLQGAHRQNASPPGGDSRTSAEDLPPLRPGLAARSSHPMSDAR